MQLRTKALDCLYLNWALPLDEAPALPTPLRYEVHRWKDEDWVFVSALLFRFSGLHLTNLPFLRISYPQMNVRLYVLDDRGRPSVLFRRMLVPFWVAPVSRFLARQPATAARMQFPDVSESLEEGVWGWKIRRRQRLEVTGRLGSPAVEHGPDLGPWETTVEYFRNRSRGYVYLDRRLRAIRTSHPPVDACPLEVELGDVTLLADSLTNGRTDLWQKPHSAWLCPRIPFVFEVDKPMAAKVLRRRVPAAETLLASDRIES